MIRLFSVSSGSVQKDLFCADRECPILILEFCILRYPTAPRGQVDSARGALYGRLHGCRTANFSFADRRFSGQQIRQDKEWTAFLPFHLDAISSSVTSNATAAPPR